MEEISLQEYRKQIEDMVDQGRYSEAVAHGKWILQQFPRYVDAYRLLGKAMLEARQNDHASDMFLRVLSADPEDMLSWVAMSEIADRGGDLDGAVWYLERAFELATDNDLVGEELRSLYGRRDGAEPERVELTRGALARLYLRGDLLSRAIGELTALVAVHPERVDYEIALAEALWRDDQRLEASKACQRVLERLPYCLKANLLLGEIWVNSGREEGNIYLRRAEALDPENKSARDLLGNASPLAVREVGIAPLQHKPSRAQERPDWMSEVEAASTGGPPLTDGEATLVDIAAALEAQIEIPSWLEEIDVEEDTATPELPDLNISLRGSAVGGQPAAPVEEAPAWLAGVVDDTEVQESSERTATADAGLVAEEEEKVGEDIPDWLAGLGLGGEAADEEQPPGTAEEDDLPGFLSGLSAESGAQEASSEAEVSGEGAADWLAELGAQATDVGQGAETGASAPDEMPEWMQSLAPPETAAEAPPAAEPAVGMPAELPVETPAEASAEPVPADIPDWLQGLAPADAVIPVEAEVPAVTEEPAAAPVEASVETPIAAEAAGTPDWLEGEGMPSGEEALAWLEQIAAGKEEELQAQVEAEIEARTAEIMGRPRVEEPQAAVVEEPAPAAEAPPAAEPAVGMPAELPVETPAEASAEPVPADIPDWLQGLAPADAVIPVEAEVPAVTEEPAAAPVEASVETPIAAEAAGTPDWLEGEGMPSGEEALAWLEQIAAGKEEELQAQVEAEIEARTAEIMGRPRVEEPQAAVVEEPAPAAEAPPAAEPATEMPAELPVETPAEALAEPVPADIPDWMRDMAPLEGAGPIDTEPVLDSAVAAEAPVADMGDDVFGWTAFGETEPDIPAAVPVPPISEPIPDMAVGPVPGPGEEVMASAEPVLAEEIESPPVIPPVSGPERAPEEVVAESIGEAFGWTGFGDVEQAPFEAEAAVPAVDLPAAAEPSAPEPVLAEWAEAPPAVEMPVVEETPPPPEAVAVEGLFEVEEPVTQPVQEVPIPPARVAPAADQVPSPAPAPASSQPSRAELPPRALGAEADTRFAAERAYLKENPRDYVAWLSLARRLWQTGDRDEALGAYSRLIRAGKSLDTVTTELEEYVDQWPDVATRRVLGDAYMKGGKLDRALALYREALETL
jgi:tetratricopeptide (TPR) repeat protein